MAGIFKRSGGYRKLYSFNFATVVHLGAIDFCKRFIPWQELSNSHYGLEPCGKQAEA